MKDNHFKLLVIFAVLLFFGMFLIGTVSHGQSLGTKISEFTLTKVSIDTYDKSTDKWTNNDWFNVKEGSTLTFYDKAIVVLGQENNRASATIYMIDYFIRDGVWLVKEAPDVYVKVRLFKDSNGKPLAKFNYMNGSIMHLAIGSVVE